MKSRIFIALLCLIHISGTLKAGLLDSTFRKIHPIVECGIRPAYTLPTNDYFKGKSPEGKPSSANLSAHLKYGFSFAPDSFYGSAYPDAVQGIGIAFNSFFNPGNIGNPLAFYVFQTAPVIKISPRLSLDYEWNFGLSFLWKEYDQKTNPYNIVVGSDANAYINLGASLNWRLNKSVNLKAGVGLTHFSNGNTKYPNGGVNTIGGNLQLAWNPNPQKGGRRRAFNESVFKKRISYDLVLYAATRKKGFYLDDGNPFVVPGSFAVLGMNFSPMYNLSKYFRAGLSLDAQFDESANITSHIVDKGAPRERIKFHRPPFSEQFAIGISARAEVIMPIFSINIGIGRNILCKGEDTDSFYQIFALKTKLTDRLFIHIGYQLFKFKNPNNLMLGFGWSFR